MFPASEEAESGPTRVQLGYFGPRCLQKKSHQGVHLVLRTVPVLRRESVEGQRLDACLTGGLEEWRENLYSSPVAGGSGEPVLLCPAAVAVHDDGDVARGALFFETGKDARLDRWF